MSDGSTVVLMIRTVVSLAVVLAIIVWAARALERRQRGHGPRSRPAPVPVTVLSRQTLSRHAGLTVVQVADRVLVLGVTDTQVTTLSELTQRELTQDDLASPITEDLSMYAWPEPSRDESVPSNHALTQPTSDDDSFTRLIEQNGFTPYQQDVERHGDSARALATRLLSMPPRIGRHRE
ncbi:hypothetical protein KEM60_00097 [Austwickia sp. TVS 96-490-7B]|uniref:FliO/MopB family protein n=1 Tax=Austwickia sp. TVS 96-490-7B TaxID=2830843 RepID=UPI001C5A4768|nr:flagellar biosynthetic protein FliO [Austwickia sp. TVS 96-490-7B]MBW3083915.1 hypothetical protein [Austwickia sp. TVS 96-490-7B]